MEREVISKIETRFKENRELSSQSKLASEIASAAEVIVKALASGNKVLICGNGGSASQAEHFAGELVGRFKLERRGLPALALGANFAALTAIANDYAYEDIFSREVESFGKSGDVLVGLSTSGNSKNVIKAVHKAKELGLKTICLCGESGALKAISDITIAVPSKITARVQEMHLLIIHILAELVEKEIFGKA